jgi:hypothetical protein
MSERRIDLGDRRLIQSALLHVAYHADNGHQRAVDASMPI